MLANNEPSGLAAARMPATTGQGIIRLGFRICTDDRTKVKDCNSDEPSTPIAGEQTEIIFDFQISAHALQPCRLADSKRFGLISKNGHSAILIFAALQQHLHGYSIISLPHLPPLLFFLIHLYPTSPFPQLLSATSCSSALLLIFTLQRSLAAGE